MSTEQQELFILYSKHDAPPSQMPYQDYTRNIHTQNAKVQVRYYYYGSHSSIFCPHSKVTACSSKRWILFEELVKKPSQGALGVLKFLDLDTSNEQVIEEIVSS